MGNARITQLQTEIITQRQGNARATQIQAEVITQATGEIRVSMMALTVLSSIGGTDIIEDTPETQYYPIICTN